MLECWTGYDLTFLNTCSLENFLPPVFRIRDPVLFWPLDPGSGINIADHISETLASVFLQISGYVTFWYGSGSADLYLWLTDPAFLSVSDFQDAYKKKKFLIFLLLLFESTFTSSIKEKKILLNVVPLGQKAPDLSRSESHHLTGRLLTIVVIFLLQKSGASWPRRCLWPAGGREHDRSARQCAFISPFYKDSVEQLKKFSTKDTSMRYFFASVQP